MKSFELNAAETTAVLRWVPHLEADRKDLYGSRPDATMTLHYTDDNLTVAVAQLTIAVLDLQTLAAIPGSPPLPRVLNTDIVLLGRVMFRLNGLSDEQIETIDQQAQALAFKLAARENDDPTKH